jgi:hypothetical protein
MAGGVADGKKMQAVLFGGAAGAFATPAHLDVKLTFEDLRAAGLPLGSGVVMVFDEARDMRDSLARLGHFFAHESCGKCYPCQMGTQRQMEILNRIAAGKMQEGDLERLQDVGWTMTDASLCGLGQTAASAVLSAVKLWPELFKDEGGRIKDEGQMGNKKKNVKRKTQSVKRKTQGVKRKTEKVKGKKNSVKRATKKASVAAKKTAKMKSGKTVVKKKSFRKTASKR